MQVLKRFLRVILVVTGCLALLVIAGAILVQSRFQGFVEDYVRQHYGWSLKIGSAELRFSPLSVRFESIELSTPDRKPFLQARSAYAALPYSSLWRDEFVIREVSVDSPHLDLNEFPERMRTPETASSTAEIPQFQIQQMTLTSAVLKAGQYTIDEVQIDGRVDSAGVDLKAVKASFRDIQVASHGKIRDWNQPELYLDYELNGDVSGIGSLFPEVGDLKGVLSAQGRAEGKLPDVVISGEVKKGAFSLDESASFNVSARYRYAFTDRVNPIHVEIDWDSLPLSITKKYWSDLPPVASLCNGSLEFSGTQEDWWAGKGKIEAQIYGDPGDKRIPLEGEIHGTLDAGAFRIQDNLFRVRSSTSVVHGTLTREGLNLKLILDTPNLNDLSFLVPALARIPGTFSARAQMEGPYRDLRIQGEVLGNSKHSSLKAQGAFRTGNGTLTAHFEGNAGAPEWKRLVPNLTEGNVRFQGSAEGGLKNPKVDIELNGSGFLYKHLRLNQADARISLRSDLLQFQTDVPDLQFSGQGSYRPGTKAFEAKGGISGIPVAKLKEAYPGLPGNLGGIVQASFEARGSAENWKQSDARLVIEKSEIQWNKVLVRIPVGVIRLQDGTAHVSVHAEADNAGFQLEGTVSMLQDFPLALQLRSNLSAGVIERLTEDWKGNGELNADIQIAGTATHPDLKGRVVTNDMQIQYLPRDLTFHIAHAEAGFVKAKIDLEGNGDLNGSSFSWHGSIPLERSGGVLHFESAGLPVSLLTSNPNVSGGFDVVADFHGEGLPLKEWNGEIKVSPRNLSLGKTGLVAEKPLQLSLENRIVRLPPSRITAGEFLDVSAAGSINLNTREVESSVRAEVKIELFSGLRSGIQSSGPLSLDLQVGGTLNKPEYTGTLQLTNASLRVPDTPLFFENIALQASLDEAGLHVNQLQARSGGGDVSGGGDLVAGRKGSYVWFKGNNVAMNYPEGLRSQVDFDLKLVVQDTDLLLSGDILVLRSFYEQRLSLRSPVVRKLLASSERAGAKQYLKNRVKLALNVRTDQDLLLRNNLANLRGAGNLKVEGSLHKPRLVGRLSIREGSRIFLLGNEFYFEKASIDFYGSELLEPNLDVTLSTLLRDSNTDIFYEVLISFGGTTSDIEIKNVRANPSLSEDQVFSLLAQGTVEGEKSGYAGAFQRQLVSFLAGQILGSPGGTIAKSIGLSRIQVQQEGLNSVNDPKTRVVLGKDIGPGFSLIYSFVLNDPQDQTWIASYRYSRNIVGRFIDQDDGSYTASVSHRIPFGKGVQPDAGVRMKMKERGPRVRSIDLENHSPLTERQVRGLLKTTVDDYYDYWRFQEGVDNIKRQLQKLGYLSPVVEVSEKKSGELVSLAVKISAGNQGRMIILGHKASEKQIENYNREWRQQMSPAAVQMLIMEDLLHQLRSAGYHRGAVNTRKEQQDEQTIYYFDVEPGPQYASVELEFHGTEHYEPEALQRDLNKRYESESDLYVDAIHDFSGFSRRVKSLYLQRGYVQTEVTADSPVYMSGPDRVVCRVNVKEGPLSRVAALNPEGAFPDELQSQLQLRPGSMFHPDALMEDELKISSYYESEGYPEVTVSYDAELKNGGPNILIYWTLKTGRIARIASVHITGNESTDRDLILRMANLKEGEALTPHKTSLARKRISDLGVFQQVAIETEETDTPGEHSVIISVTESKRYEFQYGGRYNTDDKLGGEIRLSDSNFLGKAQNVSLYVRSFHETPLFRVDYMLPITGSLWDRTRVSYFRDVRDDDIEATVSDEKITFPFQLEQLALQFQQDRRFGKAYNLIWGFEYGSYEATFPDLETAVPIRVDGSVARLRSAFVVEKRDDPLNAQKGYFYSADVEFAPTLFGSDVSYSKLFSQYFVYRKFGNLVSATGLRAGFLRIRSNILAISEKFRTGGGSTLRGFGLNQVVPGTDPVSIFFGGDSVFILNQEIRFPIYKWFSGAAFYDGGNVYFLASDFDPFSLRHSAGFGIRAGTGGFLLRLDLGFNLDPRENESHSVVHFSIGQAF